MVFEMEHLFLAVSAVFGLKSRELLSRFCGD